MIIEARRILQSLVCLEDTAQDKGARDKRSLRLQVIQSEGTSIYA